MQQCSAVIGTKDLIYQQMNVLMRICFYNHSGNKLLNLVIQSEFGRE